MKTSLLYEESCDTIQGFVTSQVLKRGLDERTEKAYRLDLEHLHAWIRNRDQGHVDETAVEEYLDYLMKEKKLKYSTVTRKYRVFRYYLEYLEGQGHLPGYRPISCPKAVNREDDKGDNELSRAEVDSFFMALNREYENLDSGFRRRVCLRDSVMMELLFYHKIEISELLRMQAQDYDPETGNLIIRRKREDEISVYLYSRELRQKMGLWLEEREHFRHEGKYEDTMFLSKFGKPLSMEMVVKIFDKYRGLAGIEREITPRDLKEGVMKGYARELVMERWG